MQQCRFGALASSISSVRDVLDCFTARSRVLQRSQATGAEPKLPS
jgi:hypothetical protein